MQDETIGGHYSSAGYLFDPEYKLFYSSWERESQNPILFEDAIKEWKIQIIEEMVEEIADLYEKLKLALSYTPTEDGTFTFPDGDTWKASSNVSD